MNKRSITLEKANKLAQSKNGLCLSNFITIKSQDKIMWKCHIAEHKPWLASFNNINSNRWCPYCAKKAKLTIEDCILFAERKSGKCLEKVYINNQTKMLWQCEYGHRWKACFGKLKCGRWCRTCRLSKKHTIDDCNKIAKLKNGKCLSIKYINANDNLIWQCEKGHVWNASYSNIKGSKNRKPTWCPNCTSLVSYAQNELYKYLLNIFPFLQIILSAKKILKNIRLELDIYIPELKLAIEYDGEYWHYSEQAINNGSLQRIQKKDNACKEKGIKLIRIRERDWLKNKNIELNKITKIINTIILDNNFKEVING